MEIGNSTSAGHLNRPVSTELERTRPEKDSALSGVREEARDERKVQAEELLDKIVALTEDGLYSVRFERDKEVDEIVVKVIEQETGELIRQIPAEEILGVKKALEDLRGNLVDKIT